MLRKHINADAASVDVKSRSADVGPKSCPQPGCQSSDGSNAYRKGFVVYEEYGGNSGPYVTSNPCKCCDSKGYLSDGERAYERYCTTFGTRDISTGYPDPHPMSREVYDSPKVLEAIRSRAARSGEAPTTPTTTGGCFIATVVYGSYESPEVLTLRRFRDDKMQSTAWGRTMVRFYYLISPPIADRLGAYPRLVAATRVLLDAIVRRVATCRPGRGR